jgi:hypothetical protein
VTPEFFDIFEAFGIHLYNVIANLQACPLAMICDYADYPYPGCRTKTVAEVGVFSPFDNVVKIETGNRKDHGQNDSKRTG